jgi:hypothetical protein
VKLTLHPDQSLTYSESHRTEEGWAASSETFTYDVDQGLVIDEWVTDGRDCDGRLRHSGSKCFKIENACAGHVDEDGIAYPLWYDYEPTEVYDEYAQAMNY